MDYAREGDAILVVGIDRLGRNAAEVIRRAAYEYLPTNDEHWQTALGAQRTLAQTGQHRAVGMADLLTATLAAQHRLPSSTTTPTSKPPQQY